METYAILDDGTIILPAAVHPLVLEGHRVMNKRCRRRPISYRAVSFSLSTKPSWYRDSHSQNYHCPIFRRHTLSCLFAEKALTCLFPFNQSGLVLQVPPLLSIPGSVGLFRDLLAWPHLLTTTSNADTLPDHNPKITQSKLTDMP